MSERSPKDDYTAQIKAIFADPDMVSAMRKRLPNQGLQVEPSVRDRRWESAVDAFCADGSDWWAGAASHEEE